MFFDAEMLDKANECLQRFLNTDAPQCDKDYYQNILLGAETLDLIEKYIAKFKSSNSFIDLSVLVNELVKRELWDEVCIYGKLVFDHTHSIGDAERLVHAYNKVWKYAETIHFVNTNNEFLHQSSKIVLYYSWALFFEGEFLIARDVLSEINSADNVYTRDLQINLAIFSGDWNSLVSLVYEDYKNNEQRNATELIQTAHLAFCIGAPFSRELTELAVHKGFNDAEILLSAYALFVNAGWDNDESPTQWINRAADLSDPNGPVQIKTLEELLDMNPEWEQRQSNAIDLLTQGDIPISFAGELLNQTAELKAIRENVLLANMSNFLQLPKEELWISNTLNAFLNAHTNLIKNMVTLSSVKAQSA